MAAPRRAPRHCRKLPRGLGVRDRPDAWDTGPEELIGICIRSSVADSVDTGAGMSGRVGTAPGRCLGPGWGCGH